ncbi:DUF6417 family protein [Streptomyces sp. RLB1-33]
MRGWERVLSVLEALWERGQAAGHGWALDTELLPPHQQQVNALERQGLVELAGREDRAELSVLEGRPVRWAARLTPYGTTPSPTASLVPGPSPAWWGGSGPAGGGADPVADGGAARVRRPHRPAPVPPADGLAEQVRTASCDHGIKRWRLHLTQEQMESVAYGLWLHRMTGSAAEANRFGREYGVVHSPARASEGPPAADGRPSATGAAAPGGAGASGRG